MQYPMLGLAGAFALGIFLEAWLQWELEWLLLALSGCLAVQVVSIRYRQGVFLAACLVLMVGAATRVALNQDAVASDIPDGVYVFQVVDFAEPKIDAAQMGTRWISISIGEQTLKWRVPLGLNLKRGDFYRAHLKLEEASLPLNTNGLEVLRYQLGPRSWFAKSLGPTVLVEPSRGLAGAWDTLRMDVSRRLAASFSGDYLGVVWALSLGTRLALSQEITDKWRNFGIGHLLAISGLHMGLVGTALFIVSRVFLVMIFAGRRLSFTRRLAALVTIGGMWAFCLWVNAPVSAVRACVMASALLGALALNRMQNGMNALGLAALFILFEDPSSLLGLGTWLSFGCTWFLIFAATRFRGRTPWYQRVWMMAVVPWLATLPICAFCFGEFYGWSVPANLVSVWVAAWIVTPAAILAGLLSGLGFELPLWLELGFCFGLDSIATWLDILGDLHPGYWQVSQMGAWGALGVVWPGMLLWLRFRPRFALFYTALALGLGFIGTSLSNGLHDSPLEFHVPYVGHGDGMVLRLPNGKTMLIDAGGAKFKSRFDPGEQVLAPLLRKLGATKIDYVVISHPDQDHIGGLQYLFERFTVGEVWLDKRFLAHPRLEKKLKQVTERGGQVRAFQSLPDSFSMGTTRFELIYPRIEHGLGEGQSTNQRSLVFRIEEGRNSLLLTGDLDAAMEKRILKNLKPTQLLKVAHHGSITSSSAPFLDKVQPCLAVVSAGQSGLELFPHASVVRRFEARRVPLFQTPLSGALRFRAQPGGWLVESSLGSSESLHCEPRDSKG